MKPNTRIAALLAFKWASALYVGFALTLTLILLASGSEISGKLMAEKVIIGVFSFPIIFTCLWVWSAVSKKNPITGDSLDSEKLMF